MQITPQKQAQGVQIKSNFYIDLNGYFREISDYIGLFCAGEHFEPVERTFGRENGEKGPELGLFERGRTQVLLMGMPGSSLGLPSIKNR